MARPRKKHALPKPREIRSRGWAVVGFDTSMSSLAGAAIGYDATMKKMVGPNFTMLRWEKDDDYFARLKEACNSHELVGGLIADMGMILELDEIYIAQEEPWPLGMSRGGMSSYMKQQAEISGAFLGGLIRWGYTNIMQMNSIHWRQMIAADLGITTHHSKWKSPELALAHNCAPKDSGKFRAKQWALTQSPVYDGEIPDWPDIIGGKDGKQPRPETSKAKAVQPDDRYDALAVMWTHYKELQQLGLVGT